MNPNRRSGWPARRSAGPAPTPSHIRPVASLLAFVTLAGCNDRDPIVAPAFPAPHFSQVSTGPVVNSLADPGDGTCDDAGTGDGCTLREAIALANPLGATITFDPGLTSGGGQEITLDPARGQLLIAKNLTIVGPGPNLLNVRRAQDASTAFRIIEIQRNGTSNVVVTIRGLTISGGVAAAAAGIADLVPGNSLTLSRVILSGHTATGEGGGTGAAVYSLGTLSIDSSTISGNYATLHAGGIMGLGTTITITNSTISDNTAGSQGGGIFHGAGTMSLQNVTISGNSAIVAGGISKQSNGGATLTHVTVNGNTARFYGGIYSLALTTPITLSNTIIANNTGITGSCGSSGPPAIADGGGNLVYPGAIVCDGIWPVTTDDPKLGPLTVNAPGITATLALGEGSAAIDAGWAGACTPRDQRGVARPQGAACDIGAYEAPYEPSTDDTPPVITPSIDGTLGTNGWYTSDVKVSWSVTDGESAVTSGPCAETTISADIAGQEVTCSATSAGGTSSESVTIKRDATGPTIAFGSVAPLANAAGWNKANVTVTWTCGDATSGLVGSSSVTQTVMTEGQNQSATGQCTDNAGNTTQDTHAGIDIDKTAPALAPTVSPNPVILNGTASATPNATDARSGIATSSCGTPTTSAVGTKSVSCSATDNAGNASTANAAYAVAYQFVGFSGRVEGGGALNVVKAGQNVPLKWRLLDAAGAPVTNLTSATVVAANLVCAAGSTTTDALAAAATGGSGLQNLGDGYYQLNWSTPKSYANTCKTMQLNLGEGTTHDALFRFTK